MLHVTRGDVVHAPVAERGDEVQFDDLQMLASRAAAHQLPVGAPVGVRPSAGVVGECDLVAFPFGAFDLRRGP